MRDIGGRKTNENHISQVARRILMSQRIRVLHLIDNLDLGGAQTVLFGMLECFDQSRFEIVLAAMHAHEEVFSLRELWSWARVSCLSLRGVGYPGISSTLPWLLIQRPVRRSTLPSVCFQLAW